MAAKKRKNSEADEKRPLPVLGATYDATSTGFLKFIAEANLRWVEGYRLLSFVKLERKLAAVFVLATSQPGQGRSYDAFLGEEEDDPIPTYR